MDPYTRPSRRSGEQGFTLVEMMVVVTIIALLSALALPPIGRSLQQARATKAMADLRTVGQAWASDTALYGQLDRIPSGTPINVTQEYPLQLDWQQVEQVLDMSVPVIDPWGRDYEYRADAFPPTRLLIRTANADGLVQNQVVAGTLVSWDDRASDLIWIGPGPIVRIDPWRNRFPFPRIPIPLPPIFTP